MSLAQSLSWSMARCTVATLKLFSYASILGKFIIPYHYSFECICIYLFVRFFYSFVYECFIIFGSCYFQVPLHFLLWIIKAISVTSALLSLSSLQIVTEYAYTIDGSPSESGRYIIYTTTWSRFKNILCSINNILFHTIYITYERYKHHYAKLHSDVWNVRMLYM